MKLNDMWTALDQMACHSSNEHRVENSREILSCNGGDVPFAKLKPLLT